MALKNVFRTLSVVAVAITVSMLAGCARRTDGAAGQSIPMRYATLLRIEQHDGYRIAIVKDPWKPRAVLHRYALVERDMPLPKGLEAQTTVIRVPLRRMCVATSVHAGLMEQLGALRSVKSVCEGKYIFNPAIKEAVKDGRIKDVGSGLNPSVELIAQLQTDALLMSPFESASYGLLEKTGIPIIECADYMENSALARAEWMRFYGMLTGREAEADSLFEDVVRSYEATKQLAASTRERPKLLVDMLQGNTWYIPGGGSIYGALYRDAAADFSIADQSVSGSQPLSMEKVMAEAKDADIWLIKYSRPQEYTYAELLRENALYSQLAPMRERHIFGCNTLRVPFYEVAPFRPDLLLRDIVHILHPQLLPDHRLIFFKPL